ncbi:hypothetical protein [Microbacterium radiodurans]|uniref:DUF4190 domain-containing protein n=1 Tax=Microbacterium radiodurans TaxID=661398 RepID=A0A5J5IQT8_9MICO|nr:hypothetical protein [Microbacterium radiodurans]KAA9084068.1 hypothetical protein F6B42_13855 [Microbacterium radiodurans]
MTDEGMPPTRAARRSDGIGAAPAAAPPTAALPGEHRGGFERALTQPTPVTESVHTSVAWAPEPEALPRSGAWALGLAVVALALSLVVGWAFPLGIAAVALAILALRRPWERRAVAVWSLLLGLVSLVYSAGWLVWAAFRAGLIG